MQDLILFQRLEASWQKQLWISLSGQLEEVEVGPAGLGKPDFHPKDGSKEPASDSGSTTKATG